MKDNQKTQSQIRDAVIATFPEIESKAARYSVDFSKADLIVEPFAQQSLPLPTP